MWPQSHWSEFVEIHNFPIVYDQCKTQVVKVLARSWQLARRFSDFIKYIPGLDILKTVQQWLIPSFHSHFQWNRRSQRLLWWARLLCHKGSIDTVEVSKMSALFTSKHNTQRQLLVNFVKKSTLLDLKSGKSNCDLTPPRRSTLQFCPQHVSYPNKN